MHSDAIKEHKNWKVGSLGAEKNQAAVLGFPQLWLFFFFFLIASFPMQFNIKNKILWGVPGTLLEYHKVISTYIEILTNEN